MRKCTGGVHLQVHGFTEVAAARWLRPIKELRPQFKAVSIQCIRARPLKGGAVALDEKHFDESALCVEEEEVDDILQNTWLGGQKHPGLFKDPIMVSFVHSE